MSVDKTIKHNAKNTEVLQMTFLQQCALCGLQRLGYSKKEAELLVEYLYPASTLEVVQSKLKAQGRFYSELKKSL